MVPTAVSRDYTKREGRRSPAIPWTTRLAKHEQKQRDITYCIAAFARETRRNSTTTSDQAICSHHEITRDCLRRVPTARSGDCYHDLRPRSAYASPNNTVLSCYCAQPLHYFSRKSQTAWSHAIRAHATDAHSGFQQPASSTLTHDV